MGSKSFTAGLLFGFAIGAAIGYLFMPEPAAEVRKSLYEKSSEVKRTAPETVKRQAQSVADKIKEQVSEGISVEDLKEKIPTQVPTDKIKERIQGVSVEEIRARLGKKE